MTRCSTRILSAVVVSLTLVISVPASAFAAGEGEACGRLGFWRASCDAGLTCEVQRETRRWKLGVCVKQVQICGGLLGASCPEGQYCDFAPDALCGAADQTGSCQLQAQACTKEYRPVCGCDDNTYGNACTAHAAGVSVVREGECGCEYAGQTYAAGDSFPAADGCNTCNCDASGLVFCTERGCLPSCHIGGCSGQLCVGPGEPDISTCIWRDEYACYDDASCELQADGRCGWTQTEELRACIDAAISSTP